MGARTAVVLGSVAAFTLAIAAFLATRRSPDCYECIPIGPLISALADASRKAFVDKDYPGALNRTNSLLKLDPGNPEVRAIHEQAESAIRELARSVARTREAMARGDAAQASATLERVLALDPRNPIVAEFAPGLNANFSERATAARSDMEKARSVAAARKGAAQDPAFAEGEKFSTAAGKSLADRQFVAATQGFVQARDAFERARRVIEDREKTKDAPLPVKAVAEPPRPCFEPLENFCKAPTCPSYAESMAKVQERISHDTQGWEFGTCGAYRYTYLGDTFTYDTATRYFDSHGVLVAARSYWDSSTQRPECPNWQHYGLRMECKDIATEKAKRPY